MKLSFMLFNNYNSLWRPGGILSGKPQYDISGYIVLFIEFMKLQGSCTSKGFHIQLQILAVLQK